MIYDISCITDEGQTISAAADTRKQKTRAALRAAMLEILAETPFDQIQILDLTGRAKVGYATFFRHYASTREVLDEVAGEEIRQLFEMTIPVFRRTESAASLTTLCRYVIERRTLWRVLLAGGAAHSVRAEFVRQAREWAARMDPGTDGGAPPVPIDLGTVCTAGSTIDALAWWLDNGAAHSAEEMAGFIDRMIISPFVGVR